LERARLLLIEKTVLEILMRMETMMMKDAGMASFSDVTRVHFANLTLEQEILHRQAEQWLKSHPSATNRFRLTQQSKREFLKPKAEPVLKNESQGVSSRTTGGFFGLDVEKSSKYAVNVDATA
jgi:hypothetical protein